MMVVGLFVIISSSYLLSQHNDSCTLFQPSSHFAASFLEYCSNLYSGTCCCCQHSRQENGTTRQIMVLLCWQCQLECSSLKHKVQLTLKALPDLSLALLHCGKGNCWEYFVGSDAGNTDVDDAFWTIPVTFNDPSFRRVTVSSF